MAQLSGVPTDKIKITQSSTEGPALLDTNISQDIYVLYGPYMVSAANIVQEKLIQLGKEVQENGR